jgi:hypothetical protein
VTRVGTLGMREVSSERTPESLALRGWLDILGSKQNGRTRRASKVSEGRPDRETEDRDMAALSIQAGIKGQGFRSVIATVALATVLVATAGTAQAADSTDRITPPSPADVAILRGLLALQHPALRQGGAATPAPTATPAVTTEPSKQGPATPAATEGEACVSPGGKEMACGNGAETRGSGRLASGFRASLDRAMAAAGYNDNRL